ncbi:M12 family metallopeptidase [Pseudomonas sp. R76]|uniref:M12 family metallopeptidase n=1 Tax=Pseudomonas sp. R76 TaxID=1573711 RepID=UPI0013200962|nr:M12 family metallopeptidase [Pseudomonas sp. R76]QHD06810.1 hypothetical protein PspR76_14215 [Pseudomonas sp. R76]
MNISNSAPYNPAYSADFGHAPASTETTSAAHVTRTKRGVADTQKLWPQNGTLTIAFMDTTPSKQQFIKKYIKDTYSPLINLTLKFVEGTEADIRISTSKTLNGNWSMVGTDAKKIPADQPTMHFDFNSTKDSAKRNIIHEFGHALGLLHEHQHPDRSFEFNIAKTYRIYKKHAQWSQAETYENILKKLKPADITHSHYDQKSIMHYGLSKDVLWKHEDINISFKPSDEDRAFWKSLYPTKIVEKHHNPLKTKYFFKIF